jgi:hypothetical protein
VLNIANPSHILNITSILSGFIAQRQKCILNQNNLI